MVNIFLYIRSHKMPKHFLWDTLTNVPEKIRYRLPSNEEWEYAAAAGLSEFYMYGYESLTDEKNIPVTNTRDYYNLVNDSKHNPIVQYRRSGCEGNGVTIPSTPDFTTRTDFGKPNRYGVYNMIGNVSEITADTTVKGLNFLTTLDGKYVASDSAFVPLNKSATCYGQTYRYTGPQAWLGFRCVCEVLK